MSSSPRTRLPPSTSPTRPRKPVVPHGFIAPPKPRQIPKMTVRELRDLHARNARILAAPTASTSASVQKLSAQQAEIEARLVELVGVETIQNQLEQTKIDDEEAMNVDSSPQQPPQVRAIDTKRRALARFAPKITSRNPNDDSFTFEEAVRIEQEAHARDLKRQQELEERKRRQGVPIRGEVLTRHEREARMWAFMSYKPTESDLEDDDEDEDGDDPSTWFEDDQDDGRKGQNIVEPDDEDISHIIRIDDSRIPYSLPREE
ncbi:hypothetical protein AcW1_004655 [Taiwanofungus camphoratus]|nr:hypothetical protein AcW2_006341 [Antrodia cinnamomea]KAI0939715.1 hypothetical protein AcV5_001040 [Antrodia cinnamomea]KAI0952631.1 hypothetical protein AcV7_008369 [Antrodia cinnamomea]KAI0960003.1 hypothetical protein AcW1_004655 [Antrodia cinnamomea]